MEYNKKLQHLSNDQITDLISKYENKNYKITDIIEEYHLDIKPAGLIKILPPIVNEDKCEYCGNFLLTKREGRASYNYEKPYCSECGHVIKISEYDECNCNGCVYKRKKEVNEKIQIIYDFYGDKKNNKVFDQLSMKEKMILINVLNQNNSCKINLLEPMTLKHVWSREYTSTSLIMDYNFLINKEIITVSPISSIDAFYEEEFPRKIDICKASFDINVTFPEEIVKDIRKNKYFINTYISDEEKVELWKEWVYRDAIDRFTEMLYDRKLELHITDAADALFHKLIDEISYTKLMTLCFSVARYFSDMVLTGKMNRKAANNAVYINVYKFYERAIINGKETHDSDQGYAGEKLRFFVEKVLGKNLNILKESPSIETLQSSDKIVNLGTKTLLIN